MSFGEGVDRLLALVSARSSGRAGDDDLEQAVSALLGDIGGVAPAPPAPAPAQAAPPTARRTAARPAAAAPVLDRTNYDDDDDDDDREGSSNNAAPGGEQPSKNAKQARPKTPSTTRRLRCAAAAAASEERATELKKRAASLRKGDVVVPPPEEEDDGDDGAGKGAVPKPQKKRGRQRRKDPAALDEEHWEQLESMPLGRQGAKMMVTFGDGRMPDPGAVEAALLGTRRCLQCAIRDARSRRRRDRESYKLAREDAIAYRGLNPNERRAGLRQPGTATVVDDPKLYFKAMAGYDTLGMDLAAGFDVAQLEALFPEEMQAYHRWKKMQSAYVKKNGEDEEDAMIEDDEDKPSASDGKEDDPDEDGTAPKTDGSFEKNDAWMGGHLNHRLEQFDLRTQQMKEQWYRTFAEVRQGSFLGRGFRGNSSWNKNRRKANGKNFGRSGTWEDLAAGSVRFLHWVGFDPRSALPPPDEETAQALGFLGYDFLGKIVERAILLRRLAEREERRTASAAPKTRKSRRGRKQQAAVSNDEESDDDDTILELRPGEQLGSKDIDEALRDSTIVAEPLYRTASETGPDSKPQLYFGPGFEERIEVELEEIVLGKNKAEELPEGEKKIRRDEDELFSSLEGAPTKLEGVFDVLEDPSEEKPTAAEKSVDKSQGSGGGLQASESKSSRPSRVGEQISSTAKASPARKKAKTS